jgi:hypothetical protein
MLIRITTAQESLPSAETGDDSSNAAGPIKIIMRHLNKIVVLIFSLLLLRSSAQQTERLYLSGTGEDNTVPWQFFCTAGMNSGKWTTIPVPSCWELQGFGKYDYGFAKDSIRGKEKGLYKYTFKVPAAWKGKKVNIVFEGSMTDTEVKINGKPAGPVHQGAFYAFRYDITRLLKFGASNLLEVTVAKHSANESVNAAERRADFWIFGGIFRPVWLEALPQEHIDEVSIDAGMNGDFMALIHVEKENENRLVVAQVYTIEGQKVGEPIGEILIANTPNVLLQTKIAGVKQWTAETPSLYIAEIKLKEGDNVLHTVQQKFGFRTVEVRPRDGVYVNNVKVKMKGVNRHSFWPASGRTTSKKISIQDVMEMKDMNMNAVRMSHYPPDDHFLDVCDSLGLFVMDELAGWHGHYDTETGSKLVKEMIAHDENHPSIIFWSNGNEGGHNFDLDKLFGQYDIQQRPVVHPWQLFGGIETQHYREYNYGIGNYDHGRDIVMPTEFLHGQFDGGHGAGLEDYWEMMWHQPLSAGGYLWDFADQGVVRRDKKDSLDTDKFRGADGIVGPYHEREGSYYAIKEIWSPVRFEEREITAQFDQRLRVENRYHFTNLKECQFSYKLIKQLKGPGDIKTSVIVSPDIKPGENGVLQLELPKDWSHYQSLEVTVADKNGWNILTKSFPLVKPVDFKASFGIDETGTVPVLTQTDSLFIVKAGRVELSIHRGSGLLVSVKSGQHIIPFNNGPVLQEGVNNFSGFTARQEKNNIVIGSKFDRKSSFNTLEWTVYPSGVLRMEMNYFPSAYFTSMVGVNFSYPEQSIRGVEYMGDGPYRVWKNRMKGNRFSIWNKAYNNTETGEYPWNYPEFKGYHSNFYWGRFTSHDRRSFLVGTETEDVFLRLFTPVWKTDQWHNYEPIFPSGDISFMQGIPGIGTKTQRNETTGPMGMKYGFYDYEKDPARALKLVLYFNFN